MDNILVTGVGGIGVGSQIVKSLKKANDTYQIIGTDISDKCILCERELNAFVKVPTVNSVDFNATIIDLIKKNKIDIVFISTINEARWYYQNKDLFEQLNTKVVLDNEKVFSLCMDRKKLYDHLSNHHVIVPRYKLLTHPQDIQEIDFFPLVLKPNNNSSSSKNVFVVFNKDELYYIANYLLMKQTVFAQEWIGDSSKEYSISITTNPNGKNRGAIAVKRDFSTSLTYNYKRTVNGKDYTVSSGITQGCTENNKELLEQAICFSRVLGSRSSLNLQGVWENNCFYIIDAHPAITSSVYLKTLCGYNEPEYWVNYYLHNLDQKLTFNNNTIVRDIVLREIFK